MNAAGMGKETIVIRTAEVEDIDALVWMRMALQEHLEKCDPEVWRISEKGQSITRQEITARLASGNNRFVIAETEGKRPIGMVLAEIVTNEYIEPSVYGHIHWLYVKESERRLGIGRILVRRSCDFFRARGIEQITVGYVVRNTEAANFWPALGFEPRLLQAGVSIDELHKNL